MLPPDILPFSIVRESNILSLFSACDTISSKHLFVRIILKSSGSIFLWLLLYKPIKYKLYKLYIGKYFYIIYNKKKPDIYLRFHSYAQKKNTKMNITAHNQYNFCTNANLN